MGGIVLTGLEETQAIRVVCPQVVERATGYGKFERCLDLTHIVYFLAGKEEQVDVVGHDNVGPEVEVKPLPGLFHCIDYISPCTVAG
jgi:hypothetical protein